MFLKAKVLPLAVAQIIAGGAFSAMAVSQAGAQVVATDDASTPAPAVQRVEITGSSIKSASIEGALPVQVITRADIQKTGVTSTEQLLATITATSASGAVTTAEGAGQSTYGEATASLRSLGGNHTLILVDGRRMANYATDGTAVDINSIPLSSIDRVEVLKDGASGVYGSDAIGGVINFITRKNYIGNEINVYGGGTKDGGGQSKKIGFVTGFGDYEKDRYNMVISGDYDKEGAIYGSQRSYAGNSWDNGGLYDQSATPSGALLTFNPTKTANASGVVPNTLASLGTALGNPLSSANCAQNGSAYDPNFGTCRYNSSPAVDLLPEITRESVSANFRFKLNNDNEFYLQGIDSHNVTFTKQQPSPVSASFLATDTLFATNNVYPAIILSPSSPYYPTAWLAANYPSLVGKSLTVSYRAFDAGDREHTDTADQSHFVAGFKGTVKGLDYDVAYVHNSSSVSESTQSGYFSQLALTKLLSNNDAFDPFSATQTPALAAAIRATDYNGQMMNSTLTTDSLEAKVTGEVMQLPAGTMNFAAGLSVRDENMNFEPSAAYQSGDISGYGGQELPLTASRNSDSLFGEVDIPILKSLETDIAVREDHYPNASSTNPKISFRYQPIQQALLRASYGTGFREPGLPELYAENVEGTSKTFIDPRTGTSGQYTETTGGNANLKPEQSEQTSFGLVLDPFKNLSMSVDYYKIRIKNLVTTLDVQYIVDQAYAGNSAYTGLVQRDSSGNITNITATNINAGGENTNGFDVDVRWVIAKTDNYGNFGLHLNGTYVSKFDLTLPDGTVQHSVAATVDSSGNILNADSEGIIFRWKHQLTFDWTKGVYSVDLAQNYQSGYWDNIPAATAQTTANHIGSFETWDLQASYRGFKNLTLSAGLRNMFNRLPPVAITAGNYFQAGYDPSYYDAHGEFGYVNAVYKF